MRRWALMLGCLASVACEAAADRSAAVACFSIQDCKKGQVCFFAQCVDDGFGIGTVYAELTPPSDSSYLIQQVAEPLVLSEGLQEIYLRDSTTLRGQILQEAGESLAGTLRAVSTDNVIPGRNPVRQATFDTEGFELRVLPGTHTVTFEPRDVTLPPKDWVGLQLSADRTLQDLPYPALTALVEVTGRVRQTSGTETKVEGARVSGVARSAVPEELLRSTTGVTDGDGVFALRFLPGAAVFDVTVGAGPNPYVPTATLANLVPGGGSWLPDLVLGVPTAGILVDAQVVDEAGNKVPDASVLFDGFAVGDLQGQFVAAANTDAQGLAQGELLPGEYRVTVAPQKSQPYALTSQVESFAVGGEVLTVLLRSKVTVSGQLVAADGQPVDDAELTLVRRYSPLPRSFRTQVDADGHYAVEVDPGYLDEAGELQPAIYELTVQPGEKTGLPMRRELIQVWDRPINRPIELYRPELVYGVVYDSGGAPLPNVVVAVYSLQLGLADEPVLVGLVKTLDGTRAGEFVLPVPTP